MTTLIDSDGYEAMFELAPVSLWLEDYSAVKTLFEQWRREGVTDVRAHLRGGRERVEECSRLIKVLKVNRRTLALYGARDQRQLVVGNRQQLQHDRHRP